LEQPAVEVGRVRLVCGWCGKVLVDAGPGGQVSHGICGGCGQSLKEDARFERGVWMGAVDQDIALAATTDLPLLITGGSHDERLRVARRVHGRSGWRPQRFLFSSCDGLPPADLARLLDLSSTAPASTLFLDDVDRLESAAQTLLSDSFERRAVEGAGPGATDPQPADPRVIVGTREELVCMVRENAFETRLFYRLNALHIDLRMRHS